MSGSPEAEALHDYSNVFLKLERRLTELLEPKPSREWRLLDMGCGYHYPNVVLFHGGGAEICGVDVEPVFFRDGRVSTFRARLRTVGLLRAVKWATLRYSHCAAYHRALTRLMQRSVEHPHLTLCHYDGHHLPFDDQQFDAVISNAVLEHVEDPDAFVAESARVLRPGGVIDMIWHNFYCPSGSHLPAWRVARSPWGHVTGEVKTFGLNRKRPDEIARAFEAHFDVSRVVAVDRDHRLMGERGFQYEGRELLTLEWKTRLAGLPEDLLVTRAYLIQAVKPV